MQRANLSTRAGDQPWHVRVAWGLASLAGFVLFWEVMALVIEHRDLPGPGAVFAAMMAWLDSGVRPDAHSVSTLCEAARPRYGAACLFDVSYDPERIQGATIPASRLVGGSPDAAPRP